MKTIYIFLFTMILFSSAMSQTAGNWNFNNTLNGTPGASITLSAMSLGSAIPTNSFNSGTEFYGEGGWPTGGRDANAYLQFTLTASSAHYLVLNTVTLVQRRSNTGTPVGSGPQSWSLRSSLDNYASDITTGTQTSDYVTYTVTLPAAFQSIASGVTFRLYGYNTTIGASGGISRFVWDNISVQGKAMSGVLAAQQIGLTAKPSGPGSIALTVDATGFAAGTDLALQRSSNGRDFITLYQEQSAANSITYTDRNLPAVQTLFYRVVVTNPDGSASNSPVVALQQGSATSTHIRGVVSQGSSIKALLHLEGNVAWQIGIWSQDGKALVRQALSGLSGDAATDIAVGAIPHGVYILTLTGEGRQISRQFLF